MRGLRSNPSIAAVCAAIILLLTSASTVAMPPAPVEIESHTVRGCPAADSCRFTATGAINDSGTVVSVLQVVGGGYSPVVGTAQWVKTFVGEHGSLTIRLESRVTADGDSLVLPETGQWVVIGATGDYAGLSGQGSEVGERDYGPGQSLDAVLTGDLH